MGEHQKINQCDLMLFADYILTEPDAWLEKGAVAIKDKKFAAIGIASDLSSWDAPEKIFLGHALLMPGLINAHTHAAMTFLRGLAEDLPLLEWLENTVFPIEKRLSPEIVELGTLLGHAEMLACGTVACIDMYIYEDAVFKAAEQSGIRCMGGEAIFAFPSAAAPTWQNALEKTLEMAEKYKNSEKIKIAINPHAVYTTTAEILSVCRKAALEHDLPIHIHLAESASETMNCLQLHGERPVAWCEKNGLFDCKVLAAHAVDLLDSEISTLAKNNVHAIHNPSSNMKLASGISPVEKLLKNGVKVALGTDGPASNNTLNMFPEMSRAALLQKLSTHSPASLPAKTIFKMASQGGASCFGTPLSGKIAPGEAADCIALNLNLPNMQPMHDPLSQIVYSASGHECILTIIAGEILYQNGKFSRFEYGDLLAHMEDLRKFALKN